MQDAKLRVSHAGESFCEGRKVWLDAKMSEETKKKTAAIHRMNEILEEALEEKGIELELEKMPRDGRIEYAQSRKAAVRLTKNGMAFIGAIRDHFTTEELQEMADNALI